MDTSIKQIMKIVIGSLTEVVEKSLDGKMSFFELSRNIEAATNAVGLEMIKGSLEHMDRVLKDSAQRKKSYHVQRNKDKREIATVHGTLEFERTYYRHKEDKSYIYLLDNMIDLEKYERIDPYCKAQIIENSADMSYAKAAKVATPAHVSRQSVKNAIREIGMISNHAHPLEEKDRKKEVKNLYIEADEDHVSVNGGKNKIMKLVYVYEGAEYVSKNRRRLIGARYFTGDMTPDDLWQEVAEYTYEAYAYDKIENIYLAGDGASWIKTGLDYLPRSKFVLDHYHLNKYVKIITAHEDQLKADLWDVLQKKDKQAVLKLIDQAKSSAEVETKKKAIADAKTYIRNNWTGIENLYGEEKYRCSTEGHISHILSSRLSSRPLVWSLLGVDEMARIRTYRANGGNLLDYYNELRKQTKKETAAIKLHKKTIGKASKGYFGSINPDTMIDMPVLINPEFKWLKDISRYTA